MISNVVRELIPPELQEQTYLGELPVDVDNCIALQEAGGPPDGYFGKANIFKPRLLLIVRNENFDDGARIVKECKKALTSFADARIGIVLIGDTMYFGRDDKRRNMWQLTFKIIH